MTEELLDVGSLVFLATHFSDMNRMSLIHPFVQSYHFQLNSERGRSVTTHQLVRGGLNVSQTKYGLDVASNSKFPLPENIIEKAREHLRKLELQDHSKNINPVDVICAEHIVMLRQLVIQQIEGEELKTALGNIRASFVSQTEKLPEDVWEEEEEESDSEGGSQAGDQSDGATDRVQQQPGTVRARGVPSLQLSERSQSEDTTHLTHLNTSLPSQKRGEHDFSGFLNFSGQRSGKGLFEDIDNQEEDNFNPSSFLSGPLFSLSLDSGGQDNSLGSENASQQKNSLSPFFLKDPEKRGQEEEDGENVTPTGSEIDRALASVPAPSTGADRVEPEVIINHLEF
jgi:hypothetical protein